jgi:hypothetical protein
MRKNKSSSTKAKNSPRPSSPDLEIIEGIVPSLEDGKPKQILPRLGPYKLV